MEHRFASPAAQIGLQEIVPRVYIGANGLVHGLRMALATGYCSLMLDTCLRPTGWRLRSRRIVR